MTRFRIFDSPAEFPLNKDGIEGKSFSPQLKHITWADDVSVLLLFTDDITFILQMGQKKK